MRDAPDLADPGTERLPARAVGAFSVADLIDLLRRRVLLVSVTAGVTMLFAALYLVSQTPVYRATAELLIDPQALQVVGRDIVRTDTAASIDFANVDSQALVLVSTSVLRQVIEEMRLERDPAFAAQPGWLARHFGSLLAPSAEQQLAQALEALKKNIVVRRVDNSLVFQIIVSHPDAQQSAAIANKLASVYFRQGNEGRSGAVRRANTALIGQITGLRAQLNQAETAVESFRSQNGLVSTGEGGLVVNQQLKDLYGQIALTTAELSRLTARRDQLAKLGPNALLSDTIPEALVSPTVTALRSQYAQTAREAASLSETLMPRHPRLIQIQAELAENRRLLSAELARIRTSIQEAYTQAAANLANLQGRARELAQSQGSSNSLEIQLRQLQGEAEAIRTVYNASLSRARELEQQQKIETSNSRLISEAVAPLRASKPPALIVLAAAALFGVCAGLGLAYLTEWLPRSGLMPQRKPKLEAMGPIVAAAPLEAGPIAAPPIRVEPESAIPPQVERFIPTPTPWIEPAAAPIPPLPSYDTTGLTYLAETLHMAFRDRSPAIILIVSLAGEKSCREATAALTDALNANGDDVTICSANTIGETLRVEQIRPGQVTQSSDDGLEGPVRVLKATSSAAIMAAFSAMRGGNGHRTRPEFMLAQVTERRKLADMAAAADAVILCRHPGREARDLRDVEAGIGPLRERLIATIDLQSRGWTLPDIFRGRRTAA